MRSWRIAGAATAIRTSIHASIHASGKTDMIRYAHMRFYRLLGRVNAFLKGDETR
jgi:hypothetical protein